MSRNRWRQGGREKEKQWELEREDTRRGWGKNSQEQPGEDVALALIFILCALLAAVAPFLALLVHLQVCCSTKTTPSRHASRRGVQGFRIGAR